MLWTGISTRDSYQTIKTWRLPTRTIAFPKEVPQSHPRHLHRRTPNQFSKKKAQAAFETTRLPFRSPSKIQQSIQRVPQKKRTTHNIQNQTMGTITTRTRGLFQDEYDFMINWIPRDHPELRDHACISEYFDDGETLTILRKTAVLYWVDGTTTKMRLDGMRPTTRRTYGRW